MNRRWIMNLFFHLCALTALTLPAYGSTFVGNGGSAGDVELNVAIRHLQETFDRVIGGKPDGRAVCSCPTAFENHPMCSALTSLNKKQTEFCSQFVKTHAQEMKDLLSGPKKIEFLWTHDPVDVEGRNHSRAADAVADREHRTITMNLDRFLEMKNYERLFLITHELVHFTTSDGKPVTDDGPIGPFESSEGSRQFINAAAAGTALLAADENVLRKYKGTLRLPQGWKHHWFDFDVGLGSTSRTPDGVYGLEHYSHTNLSFRYYPTGSWGFVGGWKTESSSGKTLGSISLDERISTFAAGLSYRWFPFHNPLTYFGQSQLILNALIGLQTSTQKIGDGDTEVSDTTATPSYEVSIYYSLPAFWRLWYYFGGSYLIQSHEYSKFPVKYDMNKTFVSTGVSYAF